MIDESMGGGEELGGASDEWKDVAREVARRALKLG
jgi:hypothetical protein